MQHRPRTKHELRCFCAREPLLAMYGVTKDEQLYVHIKIYKNKRTFGEVVITEGTVHIRCRECFRWQRVIIVEPGHARLRPENRPQALHHEPVTPAPLPPSDTPS